MGKVDGLGNETIRRFCLDLHEKENDLVARLAMFVDHLVESEPALAEGRLMTEAFAASDTLQKISDYLEKQDPKHLKPNPASLPHEFKTVLSVLTTSTDQSRLRSVFFAENDSESSYYLTFRYSTVKQKMVGGFLVLKRESKFFMRSMSFTHFYVSEEERGQTVRRQSDGLVLELGEAFYLVGGGRLHGRMDALGLKVIALEKIGGNTVNLDRMSGVFLSNARNWQPIVGRVALVHIGFSSAFGETQPMDEQAAIGVFHESCFEARLEDLQGIFQNQKLDIPTIKKFVLDHINLYPDFDIRNIRGEYSAFDGLKRAVAMERFKDPLE